MLEGAAPPQASGCSAAPAEDAALLSAWCSRPKEKPEKPWPPENSSVDELTLTPPSLTRRPAFLGGPAAAAALLGGSVAAEWGPVSVSVGGGERDSLSFSRRRLHFSFSPPSPLLRRRSLAASDRDREAALLEEEGGSEEEEECGSESGMDRDTGMEEVGVGGCVPPLLWAAASAAASCTPMV
ncbi:hypothetical protein EYF80_043882 [Liparis tanakae]|uniref:Uncharacterized protein n=1 Tax=Liparis tanakae TaxID=230148 RepID=A0A4Z2FZ02_9TELE|nr:hypothetical protein EYF80_043882 [Liparis tanakae]